MNQKVTGYTAQARWYAEHTDDENVVVGWTRLSPVLTKPVFATRTGDRFVVLGDSDARAGYAPANGLNHRSVRFVSVATPVVATEEALYVQPEGGR